MPSSLVNHQTQIEYPSKIDRIYMNYRTFHISKVSESSSRIFDQTSFSIFCILSIWSVRGPVNEQRTKWMFRDIPRIRPKYNWLFFEDLCKCVAYSGLQIQIYTKDERHWEFARACCRPWNVSNTRSRLRKSKDFKTQTHWNNWTPPE